MIIVIVLAAGFDQIYMLYDWVDTDHYNTVLEHEVGACLRLKSKPQF